MSFTIKSGDTLPALAATLTDDANVPVSLTGATVKFEMYTKLDEDATCASTALASRTPIFSTAAVIVVAASGTVRYDWATGNTSVAGDYDGFFVVTPSGGGRWTFPTLGSVPVTVVP